MKVLVDMSLSPAWVHTLREAEIEAVHWSTLGTSNAPDAMLMKWARENAHIVFTHDLDFGTLLALTHASGPSVIQVRTQDVTPSTLGPTVTRVMKQFEQELTVGALIVIEESSSRVRILPI